MGVVYSIVRSDARVYNPACAERVRSRVRLRNFLATSDVEANIFSLEAGKALRGMEGREQDGTEKRTGAKLSDMPFINNPRLARPQSRHGKTRCCALALVFSPLSMIPRLDPGTVSRGQTGFLPRAPLIVHDLAGNEFANARFCRSRGSAPSASNPCTRQSLMGNVPGSRLGSRLVCRLKKRPGRLSRQGRRPASNRAPSP